MTRPVASQRFRQRKLNYRSALQVVREGDLNEDVDNDPNSVQKVETGVEKHEETEHHLQAAISASHAAAVGGKVSEIYIPTPETTQSSIPYERLYELRFAQPATYIRFSSTVEDCCGCPYNMTEEDDAFLKTMNEKLVQRRSVSIQCSDDQFEEVMNFFEETAKVKHPFSGVGDPPPIVAWDEMQDSFDEDFDESLRVFAPEVYEHWHARRSVSGNAPLQPTLRLKVIEGSTDVDDNDPYVCFRRREVRQIRKTRGRDAQSVEKLRKLRRELEDARTLVAMVKQREMNKRDQLVNERLLFEQRQALRGVKRNLPDEYKEGDEDLLINQKPLKKKPVITVPPNGPASAKLPTPNRPGDGKASSETDLVLLSDVRAEKECEIEREIEVKKQQHNKWNENFVDRTRVPLDEEMEDGEFALAFRPATTEYLPTPPASVSSEISGEQQAHAHDKAHLPEMQPEHAHEHPQTPTTSPSALVRFSEPQPHHAYDAPQPMYRRRTGRGGRTWLDRRGLVQVDRTQLDPVVADRWKYDCDDEPAGGAYPHGYSAYSGFSPYVVDLDDPASMRYRAAISGSTPAHTLLAAQRFAPSSRAASSGNLSGNPPPRA